MASQVQLTNTFNEFRQAYNDAANDVTTLQSSNTSTLASIAGANASISTLNSANNALYNGTAELVIESVEIGSLTSGRVVLTGALGEIQDNANLTFDQATDTLTVTGTVDITGNTSVGEDLDVTGNFAVNSTKFTVDASTGDIVTEGNVTFVTAFGEIANLENNLLVGEDVEGWATTVDEDLSIHRVISVEDVDGPSDHAAVNQSDGEDAYAEFIAINDEGNSEAGWCSFGINSSNYAAAQYGVTKADDGYLLYQAPEGTLQSGDLVIGTGGNGTGNKILFSANGFDDPANNTQMTIDPGNKVEISIDTESTSTSTGALVVNGGIGLTGNLNVGGNVNIVGQITLGGGGNTVSLSTLEVDGTIVQTGNNNPSDLKDIGLVGSYVSGIDRIAGFVRDASDGVGVFKIFSNANSEFQTDIANTVNFADPDLVLAPVQIGSATIANTTVSSSTTTGALVVSGGAGIAGAAYIGGIARIQDSTASTTTSSGALTVSGGVGISGNTNIGGNVTIATPLDASSGGTGVSSLGANVANWFSNPSSANLALAVTDETGSGSLVFGTTPILTGYREAYSEITSSSNTATLDFNTANIFELTLSEDVTTFTWNNAPSSGTSFGFTLKVIQDSTPRTITWPASVKWPGGVAPILSNGNDELDVFVFFTTDGGSNYYGFVAGQDLS